MTVIKSRRREETEGGKIGRREEVGERDKEMDRRGWGGSSSLNRTSYLVSG